MKSKKKKQRKKKGEKRKKKTEREEKGDASLLTHVLTSFRNSQRRFPDGLKTIVGRAEDLLQFWSMTRNSRMTARCQALFS